MKDLVLDASAAVCLTLGHPGVESDVLDALSEAGRVLAPRLFFAEVANALWKYVRAGGLAEEDALDSLREARMLVSRPVDDADLIAGYRAPRRDPFMRVVYGKGWSTLCTLLFGYTVRDVDCGFKLLRREIIQDLAPHIESRGATFSIEWLVRAKRAGYRFAEIPVTHWPRVAGSQTGANINVITRAFRELWRVRVQLWREGPAGRG